MSINDQELRKIFSKNLSRLLLNKNLTQTKLAKDLGLPNMTISNWITAKTYPKIKNLQLLADYFEIDKSDLIDEPHQNNLDIGKEIETLLKTISSSKPITFYGEPLTKKEKEELEGSIQAIIRLKKQQSQKRSEDSN